MEKKKGGCSWPGGAVLFFWKSVFLIGLFSSPPFVVRVHSFGLQRQVGQTVEQRGGSWLEKLFKISVLGELLKFPPT